METLRLRALIRRRLGVVIAIVAVSVAAAALLASSQTPQYRTSARLLVAPLTGLPASEAYQAALVTPQEAQVDAQLASAPTIVAAAARRERLAPGTAVTCGGLAENGEPLFDVVCSGPVPSVDQAMTAAISELLIANTTRTKGTGYYVALSVIAPAALPVTPVSPRTTLDLLLGGVFGLAVGLAVAALLEQFRTTLRDGSEFAAATGLPLLCTIPNDRTVRGGSLTSPSAQEAVRYLRTAIAFAGVVEPVRSLLVTSPLPNDGKSTIVTNLAQALGAGGCSVCVVDADLRRPSIANSLGLEQAGGVTDLLLGRASIEDVLRTVGAGYRVLTAGQLPPNPSELVGSTAMQDLISALEARFEVVLVDTPPVLAVTDAVAMSPLVTAAVLVGRAGRLRRDEAAKAAARLAGSGVRVLGVLLNRADRISDLQYYDSGRYYPDAANAPLDASADRPRPALLRGAGPRRLRSLPAEVGERRTSAAAVSARATVSRLKASSPEVAPATRSTSARPEGAASRLTLPARQPSQPTRPRPTPEASAPEPPPDATSSSPGWSGRRAAPRRRPDKDTPGGG